MLTCTQAAFAMQEQVFSLAKDEVNANWTAYNDLSAAAVENGVAMTARETGVFMANIMIERPAQAMIITTSSDKEQTVHVAWIVGDNVQQGMWYRTNVTIKAGEGVETAIALNAIPEWKNDASYIGIELPQGTALTLHSIRLLHASLPEQLREAFLSFWTFDAFRPYSINFGWGPQIAVTAVQRMTMFDTLPPRALSATYVLYVLMIALLAACVLAGRLLHNIYSRPRFIVTASLCVMVIGWVFMDVRMGSEFLSWMMRDMQQYIAAPVEERTFRDRHRFYDFAAFVAPLVADRKHYVFFAEVPWPYVGNIGYITYPSLPSDAIERDDTWVIYRRNDMKLNAANELESDGKVVSAPGEVIGRFDDSSFVFRLSSPPFAQ